MKHLTTSTVPGGRARQLVGIYSYAMGNEKKALNNSSHGSPRVKNQQSAMALLVTLAAGMLQHSKDYFGPKMPHHRLPSTGTWGRRLSERPVQVCSSDQIVRDPNS